MNYVKTIVSTLLLVLCTITVVFPENLYRAYSIKEAEKQLRMGRTSTDCTQLAQITRLMGFIVDFANNDVILVGKVVPNEPSISINDFATALRSRIKYDEWPGVSIDPNKNTHINKIQTVRYDGHVESTAYGLYLYKADSILKCLALDLLPSNPLGIQSYYSLSYEDLKKTGKTSHISSRFWYDVAGDCRYFCPEGEGIFIIENLRIGIIAKITAIDGKQLSLEEGFKDVIGESFAASLSNNYAELCAFYPEVARLKALYDLAAVGHGIKTMNLSNLLGYWISEYNIKSVMTPSEFSLLTHSDEISTNEGTLEHVISGGIEMKALMYRLADGDATAIKEIILRTRPKASSLWWEVPLRNYEIKDYPEEEIYENAGENTYQSIDNQSGCSITREIAKAENKVTNISDWNYPLQDSPARTQVPSFRSVNKMSSHFPTTAKLGGVWLGEAAEIKGDPSKISVPLSSFSFILNKDNAKINNHEMQKFITSLWAVYFSKTPPGISIDPIAPGVEKHLVRYIGDVINSDLGRVMREADYTMKKWAVGTERPNIAGFKNVDDITATRGHDYVGASRRFWFVPEEMSFTQSDNMLLFNGGRMTLKTEYILQNKASRANPADEEFAGFFTDHYMEIAQKYPEYQELFDYAKLVSLAQYLKQNNVPLLWYLLANKDLVMTEDSPGVVDELAKGSKYFDNIEIRGGVEMDPAKGRYVYDQSAVAAINKAIAAMPSSSAATSLSSSPRQTVTPAKTFSFDLNNNSYTVVPQHSLTSGKDRRGIRYQTDLAFRNGDLPGLEMVRYFNPAQRSMGEFGDGWHLLIPYQVVPADSEKVEFQNVLVPKRMAFTNLLSREKEVLEFSRDRYSIVGWAPDSLQTSQVVGLFLMTDVSYRLADKIGNEFWFDQAGHLTDMLFGDEHHYKIKYGVKEMLDPSLENSSFDLANNEYEEFLNAYVPKHIKLTGNGSGLKEHFTFNSNRYDFAGYIPDDEENSKFKIAALMSNGSLRLVDKNGHEHIYDPAFNYTGSQADAVESYAMGEIRVDFEHEIRNGCAVIIGAKAYKQDASKPFIVLNYHYDSDGRLCRVERGSEAQG